MKDIAQVQKDIIDEFGSRATRERYTRTAEQGFWESEEILVKKYFKPNSIILDIGCGSGRTTIPLLNMGHNVIGVDITPQMIEIAKKVAKAKSLDIDYRVGDATNLEFQDNYFDNAIFANNGWVQIPSKEKRQKALNEIYRVLKPSGIYIFTAHKRYYSGFYFLFWVKQWFRFYILRPLGIKIEEIDFGDRYFRRQVNGKKINQKQYIHIASIKEVRKQIKKSGFKLIKAIRMGEVSRDDAVSQRASLSKREKSEKTPIFYICEK
ncbi:MAG: class I SAM-dependent methyltransferase [Patescibacteria group bacterium]|nr:class I SAM-dependent methyltransferase [Patescibacteria group bacterium]